MGEDQDRTPVPRSEDRAPSPGVPRPVVGAIALGFTAVGIWHVIFDGYNTAYEGSKITMFLGFLVLAILGFDISKLFRGGGP